MTESINIESYLRDVVDFPKPGIVFKDITPLLANPAARQYVVDEMATHFKVQIKLMLLQRLRHGVLFLVHC